jgi:RNA polymerase sigma factor (sigma-70 family)
VRPFDVVELDDALERLRDQDERPARAIELHYFGGLSYAEIAEALAVSEATVDRDMRFARAWLRRTLRA